MYRLDSVVNDVTSNENLLKKLKQENLAESENSDKKKQLEKCENMKEKEWYKVVLDITDTSRFNVSQSCMYHVLMYKILTTFK